MNNDKLNETMDFNGNEFLLNNPDILDIVIKSHKEMLDESREPKTRKRNKKF